MNYYDDQVVAGRCREETLQTRVYAHCEKKLQDKNEPTTKKTKKNIGVQPPNAHRWTYRSPMHASMLTYYNDASMVIEW